MLDLKNKFQKIPRSHWQIAGVLFLILLAVCLLWFSNVTSTQSLPAMVAQVYFDGEYRIGDGEWREIVSGEHIPSTQGDVTLCGNFHMLAPDGQYVGIYRGETPIAFYMDHLNLTFYEVDREPFVFETENPLYGKSSCGVVWGAYTFTSESYRGIMEKSLD